MALGEQKSRKTEKTLAGTAPVRFAGKGPGARKQAVITIKDGDVLRRELDWATLLGLFLAFGVVIAAVLIAGAVEAYLGRLSLGALAIVLGGTFSVITISSSFEDIANALSKVRNVLWRELRDPQQVGEQVIELAEQARQHGPLALETYLSRIKRSNPFLTKGLGLIIDGVQADELEHVLEAEMHAETDASWRAAAVIRRAAEVAPAMGLIGTLVGLVAMLFQLDDPNSIGPPMAVALLTTLYGAMLGTVVFGPIAAKLERRAEDDMLINRLYRIGMGSILKQENPRRLELVLNTVLPPHQRVRHFD